MWLAHHFVVCCLQYLLTCGAPDAYASASVSLDWNAARKIDVITNQHWSWCEAMRNLRTASFASCISLTATAFFFRIGQKWGRSCRYYICIGICQSWLECCAKTWMPFQIITNAVVMLWEIRGQRPLRLAFLSPRLLLFLELDTNSWRCRYICIGMICQSWLECCTK